MLAIWCLCSKDCSHEAGLEPFVGYAGQALDWVKHVVQGQIPRLMPLASHECVLIEFRILQERKSDFL